MLCFQAYKAQVISLTTCYARAPHILLICVIILWIAKPHHQASPWFFPDWLISHDLYDPYLLLRSLSYKHMKGNAAGEIGSDSAVVFLPNLSLMSLFCPSQQTQASILIAFTTHSKSSSSLRTRH